MGDYTANSHKCQTMLFGKSLIDWQLLALRKANILEISMVTGYLSETLKFQIKYFENKNWSTTNMVSSLLCADTWLSKNVNIISYSDIVYSYKDVNKIKNVEGDIVVAYDPNWEQLWSIRFEDPLCDAETFKIKGSKIIEIGNKPLSINEIEGQYIGLIKITQNGWNTIKNYLCNVNQKEIEHMDMTSLLKSLIHIGVDIVGVPIDEHWFEVDTEDDLLAYNRQFKINPIKY